MFKFIDLTEKTFGNWTVLNFSEMRKKRSYWLCECKCGKIKCIAGSTLRNNTSKGCSECAARLRGEKRCLNIKGNKFGKWFVVKYSHTTSHAKYWECRCECGTIGYLTTSDLRGSKKQRCKFCSMKWKGLSTHRLYGIYSGIKSRCKDKNHKYFYRYGGRGIKLCKKWDDDYLSFYNWSIKNGWSRGLDCDRIDNDGDYTPENCQFLPRKGSLGNSAKVHIDYKKTIQENLKICKEFILNYCPEMLKKSHRCGTNSAASCGTCPSVGGLSATSQERQLSFI